EYPIGGDDAGHQDADVLTVGEFCQFLTDDAPTETSPIAARYAVAAAAEATASLRAGSTPRDVRTLRPVLADYCSRGQQRSGAVRRPDGQDLPAGIPQPETGGAFGRDVHEPGEAHQRGSEGTTGECAREHEHGEADREHRERP